MKDSLKCVYCGTQEGLTRDHVPPKCLFLPPYPKNLLTVPACRTCNKSFSADEEYFRIAVSAEANRNVHPIGSKIWWGKVFGSTFIRSPKLRAHLAKNVSRVRVRTDDGHVMRIPILKVDARRVNRIIMKIAKGLLWHHYGTCLSDDASGLVWKNPPFPDDIIQLMLKTKPECPHPHIFAYRHALVGGGSNASMWGMQFYDNTHFLLMINCGQQIDTKDAAERDEGKM